MSTWRAVLDELDLGLMVCDRFLQQVRLANRAAAAFLSALGEPPGPVPAALLVALGVRRGDDLPTNEFACAVELAAPTGQRFFVRAKRLRARGDGVLITSTLARLRLGDLLDLLHRDLGLTHRQGEFAVLVRAGFRNRAIAEKLGVTERTVDQYLSDIYGKIGVGSRTELVARVNAVIGRGGDAQID